MSETHATFQSLLLQEWHAYMHTCRLASNSATLLPAADTVKQTQVLLKSCHHASSRENIDIDPRQRSGFGRCCCRCGRGNPCFGPSPWWGAWPVASACYCKFLLLFCWLQYLHNDIHCCLTPPLGNPNQDYLHIHVKQMYHKSAHAVRCVLCPCMHCSMQMY